MAEVSVEINGRKYRMACEDGQEAHLEALADRFNRHIDGFKGSFGEIGDTRLTVMAGIAVLDDLAEAERRIQKLETELARANEEGRMMAEEAVAIEARFAQRLEETARRVELAAVAIESAGQNGDGH